MPTLQIGGFWEMPHYLRVKILRQRLMWRIILRYLCGGRSTQGVAIPNVLTIGGQTIAYTASPSFSFSFLKGSAAVPASIPDHWSHLAVVSVDNAADFYVDGRLEELAQPLADQDLQISGDLLVDEVRVSHITPH